MNYKLTGCSYVHTPFVCSVRCILHGCTMHTIRKGSLLYTTCSPEVGIRNLSPYLCNSAILRTTISIAELRTKKKLRNCDCGPSKFDFRNSATLRSLLPAPLLFSPFSSAGFKNQSKIILELSVSLEAKTFPF
jgi:hypothetical protein